MTQYSTIEYVQAYFRGRDDAHAKGTGARNPFRVGSHARNGWARGYRDYANVKAPPKEFFDNKYWPKSPPVTQNPKRSIAKRKKTGKRRVQPKAVKRNPPKLRRLEYLVRVEVRGREGHGTGKSYWLTKTGKLDSNKTLADKFPMSAARIKARHVGERLPQRLNAEIWIEEKAV